MDIKARRTFFDGGFALAHARRALRAPRRIGAAKKRNNQKHQLMLPRARLCVYARIGSWRTAASKMAAPRAAHGQLSVRIDGRQHKRRGG